MTSRPNSCLGKAKRASASGREGRWNCGQARLRQRRMCGSDIHVMLALCCRSRQVVMANEELNGTDVVGELLGKRQRCAYQTRNALSQRVVEALDVIRFPRKLGDRAVLCRRNHLLIHDIVI